MSGRWSHLLLVVLVVGSLVAIRWASTGDYDLADIDLYEEATGVRPGPETEFFARGLHGDGATFATVALDPFGQDIAEVLKARSYRYLRFAYPWLAALATWGESELVLLGLVVVGFLAVAVTAWVSSRLNETRGPSAWLLIINPALIMGALGDTAESLALTLLAVAIYSGSDWVGWSVSVARPTYLVSLAGRWRVFFAGLATVVLGKAYWSWHFEESFLAGGSNLTWPLAGILEAHSVLGWVVLLAGAVTAVIGVISRDWAWAISGAFVLCFGQVVFDTPTNAVRAAGYLPVLWAFGPRYVSSHGLRELFRFLPRQDLPGEAFAG